MVESQARQRDIGQCDERDDQRKPAIERMQLGGRKHQLRQRHQQRRAQQRGDQRRQQRIEQRTGFVLRAARHVFGKAAFQPQRGQHRHQFNNHGGIGKAAQRFGAVQPASDEQEGKARRQPQQIAKETGAPALGQCGGFRRVSAALGRRLGRVTAV